MAITTFERKEIKFLLNMEQYNALTELLPLYMEPDKFCIGGKDYGIYNLYYDTPDDYLIRESLAKPYYKEKIRLRSYAESATDEDRVFLEIKKKKGGVVNKRRVTLTLKEAENYIKYGIKPEDLSKYSQKQILGELDVFMKNYYPLMPKQYISYQRSAWFGKDDKNFRLTFDRQLTGRRDDLSLSAESYGDLLIGENQRLMEVKILDSMPMWLADCLADLHIYKTSFSKYGTAYKNYIKNKIEYRRRRLNNYA
jgi:hypothetical protein